MPNQFHEILVILITALSSSIAAPIVQNVTGTVLSSTNIARSKIIWDILKYIGTNYIAHAFTINTAAGYGSLYATTFGLTSLFFPYIGLSAACRSLEQMAILEKDPLKRAARAGALCMVVRTKYWKPRSEDKVWCWQQNDKNGQINASPVRLNYEGLELEYLSQRYVKIHGLCRLPQSTCSPPCANSSCKENHHQEYMMARVPQDFKVKWTTLSEDAEGVKSNRIGAEKQNQTDWFKESQCEISSLHSIPKTFLALIQLVSALPTIWQGRNDKRGYAAYQLTLVPYALMSLINILCSFLTPNYPTVYMIKSTTMEEAIRRGGQFDGTVGELCETDPKEVGSTAASVLTFIDDKISFEPEDFSQTKLSEWEKLPLLKMIWDTVTYIYKHLIDEHLRREIYIVRFHWRKPGRMTSSNVRRIFRTAPKHDRHSHLIMLSPFGCPKFREWKTIDTTMTVVADLLLIVSLLVPYIVMGIFSQFRTGTSRWYQRALFITWLVLGQFLYSYQRLLWGYIQARIPPLGTKWLNGVLAILMIAIVIHALAAVGGFVVVGSMIWQDTIHPANATI